MECNTERMTRLLLLWLELQSAVGQARALAGRGASIEPWSAEDAQVREVWRQLTDPSNRFVLERWLYQSADGQPAAWAREALRVCRERSGAL
jgi:hypothetical protein